ncbi:uncharacterized protein LOC142334236 [Lycorma delicatula]|uniref:uncharacterized protein LOC142334236 n=1 Tax=Lycorma delicatula TaxID=130591 RepID=UPI003F5164CD
MNFDVFYKICRLCACESAKVTVNMFSEVGKRHQLPDKVRLCLPITIDEDDKLPKEICVACLNKLDVCNELYHSSFTAQNILKSKLESIISEEQSKEGNFGNVNGAQFKCAAETPSKSLSNRLTTIEVQASMPYEKNKKVLHDPQNTSVIPKDVVVRLTSSESDNLNRPSMTRVFGADKPAEGDSGMMNIVVTDINGAPLTAVPSDNVIFTSSPQCDVMKSNVSSVPVEEPDSSECVKLEKPEVGGNSKDEKACEVEQSSAVEVKSDAVKQNRIKLKASLDKGVSEIKMKCGICSKFFAKDIIQHHRRLHLKERLYSCVDCGKNFCTELDLSSHICGKM